MSVWICRAGKQGKYHDLFLHENKIFLAWEGLDKDLSTFANQETLKAYIMKECNDTSDTAIRTHSGQVKNFTSDMQIGDYVITPATSSGCYSIGVITSDYQYSDKRKPFHHSRDVRWLAHGIERKNFSDKMTHTLGAYRTIFSLKDDTEFFLYISQNGLGRN